MYEFDKVDYLERINQLSLFMLYSPDNKEKGASRDKLLALVKDLADGYEAASKYLNAIELAKSRGSESGKTENKENRSESKPVCKFTYETMSARCKRSLGKGFYYIFLKPKFEILKDDCERKRKEREAIERCFG